MTHLSRCDRLAIGTAAAGGLLRPTVAGRPERDRVRLSLNENPFGPSPPVLEAIKAHLEGLSRYTGNELTDLTNTIAERENIGTKQVVLGEILDALGRYLSARGGPGGEFIHSEPGCAALVDAVAPAAAYP